MFVSPEAVFTYSELRSFLAIHLGKKPAPSTLNAWMDAVLELPEYDRESPRKYGMDDAIALVCWAIAGEKAKTGERKTRAQRRVEIYQETLTQWLSKISAKSTSPSENSPKVSLLTAPSPNPPNPVTACAPK